MSSLQDSWKMDDTGIDFVLNRKFPRDTKDMSLVSGWYIIAIEFPRKKLHKSLMLCFLKEPILQLDFN